MPTASNICATVKGQSRDSRRHGAPPDHYQARWRRAGIRCEGVLEVVERDIAVLRPPSPTRGATVTRGVADALSGASIPPVLVDSPGKQRLDLCQLAGGFPLVIYLYPGEPNTADFRALVAVRAPWLPTSSLSISRMNLRSQPVVKHCPREPERCSNGSVAVPHGDPHVSAYRSVALPSRPCGRSR
jgi:hypothetical protein